MLDIKLKLCYTFVSVLSLVLLVVAPVPSTGSKLLLQHSDSHVLQASYKDKNLGIVISASKYTVEIKSLNGDLLASSKFIPNNQLQLTQILESSFVRLNKFDYLISKTHAQKAKQMTSPENNAAFMGLVHSQPQKYTISQLRNVVTGLVSRQEKELFLKASIELANEGITGMTHPHVLPFFMFVTHLEETAKALKLYDHQSQDGTNATRQAITAGSASAAVSNSTSDDCLDDCPPCTDEDCLGLCGYGCNCWSFICGDCCYHLGCYEHDMCCRQNFFSTQCLFPFQFECKEHYYC